MSVNFSTGEFVAHSGSITALTFCPKSQEIIATGGDDYKLNIWKIDDDRSTGRLDATRIWNLGSNKSAIKCICFDNEAQCVVSGTANGSIKVFDMNEGKLARNVGGHQVHVTAIQYHPFGEFIASGSIDCSMKLWDVRNKACIQTYTGHEREITCVRFSPDGRWVASSSKDGNLIIYDLVAGKLQNTLKMGGNIYPLSFEFNPVEYVLAICTTGRQVKLYDLDSMEIISMTPAESSLIKAMSFSYDGNILYSSTKDYLRSWYWDPSFRMNTVIDVSWDKMTDFRVNSTQDLLGVGIIGDTVQLWSLDLNNPYIQIPPNTSDFSGDNGGMTPKTNRNIPASPQPTKSGIKSSSQKSSQESGVNPSRKLFNNNNNNHSNSGNTYDDDDITTTNYNQSNSSQYPPRASSVQGSRRTRDTTATTTRTNATTSSSDSPSTNRMNINDRNNQGGGQGGPGGHWISEDSSRDLASSMSDVLWKKYQQEQITLKKVHESTYTDEETPTTTTTSTATTTVNIGRNNNMLSQGTQERNDYHLKEVPPSLSSSSSYSYPSSDRMMMPSLQSPLSPQYVDDFDDTHTDPSHMNNNINGNSNNNNNNNNNNRGTATSSTSGGNNNSNNYIENKNNLPRPPITTTATSSSSSSTNNNNNNNNSSSNYNGGQESGQMMSISAFKQQYKEKLKAKQQENNGNTTTTTTTKTDDVEIFMKEKAVFPKAYSSSSPHNSAIPDSTPLTSNNRQNDYNNQQNIMNKASSSNISNSSGNKNTRPPTNIVKSPPPAYQSDLIIPDYPSFAPIEPETGTTNASEVQNNRDQIVRNSYNRNDIDMGNDRYNDRNNDNYNHRNQRNPYGNVMSPSTSIDMSPNRNQSFVISPTTAHNSNNNTNDIYDDNINNKGVGGGGRRNYENIMKNTRDNNLQIADNLMLNLLNSSTSIHAAVSTRVGSLKMLRKFYLKKEWIEIMDYLYVLYEGSRLDHSQIMIISDFLTAISIKNIPLTLHTCYQLSMILEVLLQEKSESILENTVAQLYQVIQPFAQLISETRNVYNNPNNRQNLDITKEERLEKCNGCYSIFIRIKPKLEFIKRQYKKNYKLQHLLSQLMPLIDLSISS